MAADAPRAVVFDWDNTLVDSWPTIHHALAITFEAMGHSPWTLDETRARVRHSLRDSFPVLFGDRWGEARDIFYAAFERVHIENLAPIDGAEDLLATLSASGLYLAVVSNKTGRYLRSEADHLGWSRFFGKMIGAGDAARDKPAPEALLMALDGGPAEIGPAVWFVGDSGIDMEIAHRTGCIPVLLHGLDANAPEFVEWPPARHFSSCRALKGFLSNSEN